MSVLHALANTSNPRLSGDVVFVHGLGGDPVTTWECRPGESWCKWLSEDRPDLAIWSLQYEANASSWFGRAMPLSDRGMNALALLDSHLPSNRPVCFIAHSLGGLLVKQVLRLSWTIAREYRHICENTRGVIFLATPHYGSDLASFADYLRFFLRSTAALEDLKAHDPQLRELNLWYRNNVDALDIDSMTLCEKFPTRGVMVVKEGSADPGIPLSNPIPVDCDHISICKPVSREALIYRLTLRFLDKALPPRSNVDPKDTVADIGRRLIEATQLDQLLRLDIEVNDFLADHPRDPQAQVLRYQIKRAMAFQELAPVASSPRVPAEIPWREPASSRGIGYALRYAVAALLVACAGLLIAWCFI